MDKIKRQKQKRIGNRAKALDYLGGKCVKCGSVVELQFDHIDRSTKKYNVSNLLSSAWETLRSELDKCQILCGVCHRLKTNKDLGRIAANAQHGTLTSYTHGKCRCGPCKMYWNMRTKEYKAAKAETVQASV